MVVVLSAASLAAGGNSDHPLIEAVKQQDSARVRALLAQRVDVSAPEADGATALHEAVHRDDLETADLLIRAGARANAATDYGVTPLSLACTNGNVAMVARLLNAGADSKARLLTGETPLMTCARAGSVGAVTALLDHGAEVDGKERSQDQTALMWAVSERHAEVARTLIDRGADVHARSKRGFTPLLFAARQGSLASARLLLAAGVRANETEPGGHSALLVATVRGHVELARFFLAQGANPNANEAGYTALHWVAGAWETELTGPFGIVTERDAEWRAMRGVPAGQMELVDALLAHGADPNAQIVTPPPRFYFSLFQFFYPDMLVGATPFLLAAMAADLPVMRVLASAGADPRRPANDGTTPLMAAAGVGRILAETRVTNRTSLEAVKLAWELGGDVNAVNQAGETALHGAAHIRSDDMVQFLADSGAMLSGRNSRGETPLAVAERTIQDIRAALDGLEAYVRVQTSTGDLLRELGAR